MSAQEQTIRQYQEWMKLNAVAHLFRAARELGVLEELKRGQRTPAQLAEMCSLRPEPAGRMFDALVATGIVERYGEDLAISHAARLLCQYDEDLGDARWERLVDQVTGTEPGGEQPASEGDAARSLREHFDAVAATQWVHTAAAMQAAEILDVGGEMIPPGARILDLGCGAAVWSCAMAYRDPQSEVVAVDESAALQAACSTAESIALGDRFDTIEGDPAEVPLPADAFDLTLLAQRLHALDDRQAERLLGRAVEATRPGGRVAVIDLFQSPAETTLPEAIAALRLQLDTPSGRVPALPETKTRFEAAGLADVQFTFLAASREGLGMAVGRRPNG